MTDPLITISDDAVRVLPDSIQLCVMPVSDGLSVVLIIADPRLGELAVPLRHTDIEYLWACTKNLLALDDDQHRGLNAELAAQNRKDDQ